MTRKLNRLEDYIPAGDAASILSKKLNRPINPKYIRQLANSKKQPIRAEQKGNHFLYHRADVEACTIRQKEVNPHV